MAAEAVTLEKIMNLEAGPGGEEGDDEDVPVFPSEDGEEEGGPEEEAEEVEEEPTEEVEEEPAPPSQPDQAASTHQLATVFAQQLAAQQQAQWAQQQAQQQAQAQAAAQARQQSPEYIAESMLEAGLNPEDPAHVFIYQQHAQTVQLQSQLQQYKQQYEQTQQQAYQLQVDAYLGTQISKSVENYNVPAEAAAALLQVARGYAASGLDPAAAVKAAVQPFQKLFVKKSVPDAAPARLPTPNKAGMRAVAATGKGSGRTSAPRSATRSDDLFQRLRAFERGGR